MTRPLRRIEHLRLLEVGPRRDDASFRCCRLSRIIPVDQDHADTAPRKPIRRTRAYNATLDYDDIIHEDRLS